jgi:hypothetical protein
LIAFCRCPATRKGLSRRDRAVAISDAKRGRCLIAASQG